MIYERIFFLCHSGWHGANVQFLGEEFCHNFQDGELYAHELEIFADGTIYVTEKEDEEESEEESSSSQGK